MCGLTGAYAWSDRAAPPDARAVAAARDRMMDRGPDGVGAWQSADGRLSLGHRRLAIIDPDGRSDQPMTRGPLTLVFNGEIYNYKTLRDDLMAVGDIFSTDGDAEVLLALYARHGPAMLSRLRGMFAIALWDERDRSLFLARDPYGIKPLYYAEVGGTFYLASQVQALATYPAIPTTRDPAALVGLLVMGSVPEPFTTHRGISALPAGSFLTVTSAGCTVPQRYAAVAEALAVPPSAPPPATLADVVRTSIRDSVAAHLVADVPLGLFLSAGIDSGAILAFLAELGRKPVAVTLGFKEFAGTPLDEVPGARLMAERYGADHRVEWIDRDDFDQCLPEILQAMDQPSADGINNWFAARGARRAGLKVVLSGLGGDELFGGYGYFRSIPRLARIGRAFAAVPGLGRAVSLGLAAIPGLDHRSPKLAALPLGSGTLADAYILQRSIYPPTQLRGVIDPEVLREGSARLDLSNHVAASMTPDAGDDLPRLMAAEASNYMRSQLLRDADWAAMAHSIELRTPFVDWPTLTKLAPVARSFAGGRGKALLADAPAVPLPEPIRRRPRSGFAVPLLGWRQESERAAGPSPRAWVQHVARHFGMLP